MSDFNTLFPNFLTQCTELNRALTPVAVVLFVVGIVSSTITGQRSAGAYMRTIARTAAYTAVLALLLIWGGDIANAIDSTVTNTLKADPGAVHADYQKALAMQKGTGAEESWWDLLDAQAIFESIVTGILWCFGWFAGIVVFYAHLTQKFILYLAYGFAPLFIGFLAVRSLHSIGVTFLLGLASRRKKSNCRQIAVDTKTPRRSTPSRARDEAKLIHHDKHNAPHALRVGASDGYRRRNGRFYGAVLFFP